MTALCDSLTGGGNWVIIQRRFRGDTDFRRGFKDYMAGFGDLDQDHWLGLQNIHSLCPPAKPCSLRIDMKDWKSGRIIWAEYSAFSLGGFTEDYQLSIAGYNSSSTSGDAMTCCDNKRRFTIDTYSGWWHNRYDRAHLNGIWGVAGGGGIYWQDNYPFSHYLYPTYVEMKVRLHTSNVNATRCL